MAVYQRRDHSPARLSRLRSFVSRNQSLTDFRISRRKSIVALESILNGEPWLYEQIYQIYRVTTRAFVNQLLYNKTL